MTYLISGFDMKELGEIDGKDMWKTISEGIKSPRTELIYNVDDVFNYGAIRQGDWKYLYGSTSNGRFDEWYGSDFNEYNYNVDDVLKSETASALAGLITYQQIQDKHDKQNNSTKILDEDKLLEIRKNALVACAKIDDNEMNIKAKCNPLESPCLFNIKDDPCERVNLAETRPLIVINLEQTLLKIRQNIVPPRNVPRDPNADPAIWNNTWTNWQDCIELRKQRLANEILSPFAIGIISCIAFAFILCCIALIQNIRMKKVKTSQTTIFEHIENPSEETHMKLSKDYDLSVIEHIKEDGRTIE